MTKCCFITLASNPRILGTRRLTSTVENCIALIAWCNSAPSFLSQSYAPIAIRQWRTGSFTLVWSATQISSETWIEYAHKASSLYNSLKISQCQCLSLKDTSPASLVPKDACSAIYKSWLVSSDDIIQGNQLPGPLSDMVSECWFNYMGTCGHRTGKLNNPCDVPRTRPEYSFQKHYLEEKSFGVKQELV